MSSTGELREALAELSATVDRSHDGTMNALRELRQDIGSMGHGLSTALGDSTHRHDEIMTKLNEILTRVQQR